MYLVTITIKTKKIAKEDEDDLLRRHRAWFTDQFDKGNFLIVGPYKDKGMAGIAIAKAGDRARLDKILSQDAYYPDYATYDVSEFQANLIANHLSDYKGQ
ncbi:YciI family protein [Streptococcus cristatus]|uniref:YCII-related domain-containing protein n=1 Tax=Streptococcus cristatus TaxID=45634 RepID=A0A139N4P6_STRCR|nr:YciI family protein [Streptococcus cristatus]KXT70903.1 hypothetical protein SCRDD08_00337 [Streptococcus cristatus]